MRTVSKDQNTVVDCGEVYEALEDPTKCCSQCDFEALRKSYTEYEGRGYCDKIPCHPSKRIDRKYVVFKKVKPVKKTIDNRSELEKDVCEMILG